MTEEIDYLLELTEVQHYVVLAALGFRDLVVLSVYGLAHMN